MKTEYKPFIERVNEIKKADAFTSAPDRRSLKLCGVRTSFGIICRSIPTRLACSCETSGSMLARSPRLFSPSAAFPCLLAFCFSSFFFYSQTKRRRKNRIANSLSSLHLRLKEKEKVTKETMKLVELIINKFPNRKERDQFIISLMMDLEAINRIVRNCKVFNLYFDLDIIIKK